MANKASQITLTLAAVDRMSHVVKQATSKAVSELAKLQGKYDAISRSSANFAQNAAMIGGVLGASIIFPVKEAVAFETAMLGVAKQVEGARDAGGKLTDVYFGMQKQVKLLARELPIVPNEIAKMVTASARMGVDKENIADFVRLTAKMSTAFEEIPSDVLADQMGKIAKLYKIPIPQIGKLADVINFLDDNAIAKGADIIETMQRIGGAASIVGLSGNNASALASTLLTLGETSETAGTGIKAMIRELSIANSQTPRFRRGIAALGLSAPMLQKGMATDAQGTIMKVLEMIESLPKSQQTTITTDIFGEHAYSQVSKLVANMKEYKHQLALANSEKAKGSVDREFSARMESTAAQMAVLTNHIKIASINFGTALLPALKAIMSVITPVVQWFAEFAENNPTLAATIGIVIGSVAALTLSMSALGFVTSGVMTTMGMFFTMQKTMSFWVFVAQYRWLQLGGVLSGLAPVFASLFTTITVGARAAWLAVSGPIGWVIAAVAIAVGLIWYYWDEIVSFFTKTDFMQIGWDLMNGLWEGIKKYHILALIWKMAKGISNAFKKALGIASPSKVFIEHGANIAKGAEIGMKSGGMPTQGSGIANGLIDSLRSTSRGTTANGGGVTIQYAPVINLAGASESDKSDFAEMLKAHSRQLMRIIEDETRNKARLSYV